MFLSHISDHSDKYKLIYPPISSCSEQDKHLPLPFVFQDRSPDWKHEKKSYIEVAHVYLENLRPIGRCLCGWSARAVKV